MGKSSKGAMGGAASGAAAGSAFGPWGTAIGAVVGGVAGMNTGGEDPQQVQQVDPAFLNSLYNQSMGTEKTAADLKMKASFDQSLAQQIAAARAARGVNPGLLQRNVARLAAEQGAKAAQEGAIQNLKSQEEARGRYLQAIGMNQNADRLNSASAMAAEERDNKQLGSLINSAGAIGSTWATANASKDQAKELPEVTKVDESSAQLQESMVAPPENSVQKAQQITNAMTMGATGQSDKRSKTNIKPESSDLVVVSDERQKDLIKTESLPANGNMGQQTQQAMQPQAAPQMQQMAPPAQAPQVPQQAPAAPPEPLKPSQTALAQANTSMAKGGRIDDLQLQSTAGFVKPQDGPSQAEIQEMLADAQRREERGLDNSVTQSADENYAANLGRWNAKNVADRAAYTKQMDDAKIANQAVNSERMARLSKFYTGNSNVNANDMASRYLPKTILNNTNFHAAQNQQAALGIANQTSGANTSIDGFASRVGPVEAWVNNGTDDALRQINPGWRPRNINAQSDERSKTSIQNEEKQSSGSMNPESFLDKLTAYSYEYKQGQKQNPNAGDGKFLSVMAQDLEKAGPVGQSMVQQDANGMKQVDYGKGFGAMLAAQVQLNERLQALESKKKGKV